MPASHGKRGVEIGGGGGEEIGDGGGGVQIGGGGGEEIGGGGGVEIGGGGGSMDVRSEGSLVHLRGPRYQVVRGCSPRFDRFFLASVPFF